MTPKEFLIEQFASVNNALGETLRQDYGPDLSSKYYGECAARLKSIGASLNGIKPTDTQSISTYLAQLNDVSNWICLIERSQLGAFSWPFAFALRRMAAALLREKDLKGDVQEPITHIIADGNGYLINNEGRVRPASSKQKFVVISFPRALKHHVLLHTIFGHELGHAALYSEDIGQSLLSDVVGPLVQGGPCSSAAALTAWLHDASAPPEIQRQISVYKTHIGQDFSFSEEAYTSWIIEFFCDIFGLVLFGPSFLAAHQAIIKPMDANPYEFNLESPTHPPYAVRHRLMVQAISILGWSSPGIPSNQTDYFEAERRFLNYLTNDTYSPWSTFMDDTQVRTAVSALQGKFSTYRGMAYFPPKTEDLIHLIDRLKRRLPPIQETVEGSGQVSFEATHITHSMYAGWIYWLSRDNLSGLEALNFSMINRLCDQGLLQQEAINRVYYPGLIG